MTQGIRMTSDHISGTITSTGSSKHNVHAIWKQLLKAIPKHNYFHTPRCDHAANMIIAENKRNNDKMYSFNE
jgi:tetrahydromethanopterin S-methyltransferase subunit H